MDSKFKVQISAITCNYDENTINVLDSKELEIGTVNIPFKQNSPKIAGENDMIV